MVKSESCEFTIMNKIIGCVPNFSEGRDALKIGQIVGEIEKVKGVIAHMLGKEVEEWQRGAVGSRVFLFCRDIGIRAYCCVYQTMGFKPVK